MHDEGLAFLVGLVIAFLITAISIGPLAYHHGEVMVLNSLHECKEGMLTKVEVYDEHWVCANKEWTKQ